MPEQDPLLDAIAEALEAAAAVLRSRATSPRSGAAAAPAASDLSASVIERARIVHPMLGERQAEILVLVEQAGVAGTTTGEIGRALNYDSTNVHIALSTLARYELVEKDTTVYPHRYRLGPALPEAA
jgi:hypothetical protein